MAQINWTKQALADLEAIGDYIARDSPAIAQVFGVRPRLNTNIMK